MRRLLTWVVCLGAAAAVAGSVSALAAKVERDKRFKVIDFEDEVVEGMNRRPLDSLSQISDRDRDLKREHLYRKRVGFRNETAETLSTLRFN